MMLIIENISINKKYFFILMKLSAITLLIAFSVILIQQLFDTTFFVVPGKEDYLDIYNVNESRLPSIYSWSYELSKGFGFVSVLIIIVEYLYKRKKNVLIWIFMGLLYSFLTKARWVMVNTLLIFGIFMIHEKNKLTQFLKIVIFVPLIVVGSYFFLNEIGINVDGIVKDRIESKSGNTRILAFVAFDKLFWDNPILGRGAVKYGMGGTGKQDYKLRSFLKGRSSQMHVGYLSLFYMFGLIGGIFFMSFLYLLLKKLFFDAKRTKMWGSFLAFTGFALANLTLVEFNLFEMGLIFALVINKYHVDQYNLNIKKRILT